MGNMIMSTWIIKYILRRSSSYINLYIFLANLLRMVFIQVHHFSPQGTDIPHTAQFFSAAGLEDGDYPHNGLSIVLHTFKQAPFTFVFNVSSENNK